MYGIYAMAASGRMQYDYKQTNKPREHSQIVTRNVLLDPRNIQLSHYDT